MKACAECGRLRGESLAAYGEYEFRKGELAMTRKTDKSFSSKRQAFEHAKGQLRECHKRETKHRADTHSDEGESGC